MIGILLVLLILFYFYLRAEKAEKCVLKLKEILKRRHKKWLSKNKMFNYHQQQFAAVCQKLQDRVLAVEKLSAKVKCLEENINSIVKDANQKISILKKRLIEKDKALKNARQNVKRRKKQLKIK